MFAPTILSLPVIGSIKYTKFAVSWDNIFELSTLSTLLPIPWYSSNAKTVLVFNFIPSLEYE